jgi:hypothetical protein
MYASGKNKGRSLRELPPKFNQQRALFLRNHIRDNDRTTIGDNLSKKKKKKKKRKKTDNP